MSEKAPRAHRGRRFVLAAVSIIVALGLLEGGIWVARAVIGGKPRLLQSDPELGWVNRPNFDGTRTLGDGSRWTVTLDDAGRRTLDLPTPSSSNAPHVVALGDSFVFGDGVDTQDHFLRGLGSALGAQVTNLGVVGYSTDQELLAYQKHTDGSDIVLLGTYLTNDLDGNLSHSGGNLLRFKPRFDGCGLSDTPEPVQQAFLNQARHKSYVVTLALSALRRIAPDLTLFDDPTDPTSSANTGLATGPAWECYTSLVDRIVDEANQRDARQIIIMLWTYHSSRRDPIAATALRARYRGRNVQVVDLDLAIQESGVDPSSLYHAPQVDPGAHWNRAGHAFVADVLLDVLQGAPRGTAVRRADYSNR